MVPYFLWSSLEKTASDGGAVHSCTRFRKGRESLRWGRVEQMAEEEDMVDVSARRRGEWWLTSRLVDVVGGGES